MGWQYGMVQYALSLLLFAITQFGSTVVRLYGLKKAVLRQYCRNECYWRGSVRVQLHLTCLTLTRCYAGLTLVQVGVTYSISAVQAAREVRGKDAASIHSCHSYRGNHVCCLGVGYGSNQVWLHLL